MVTDCRRLEADGVQRLVLTPRVEVIRAAPSRRPPCRLDLREAAAERFDHEYADGDEVEHQYRVQRASARSGRGSQHADAPACRPRNTRSAAYRRTRRR